MYVLYNVEMGTMWDDVFDFYYLIRWININILAIE